MPAVVNAIVVSHSVEIGKNLRAFIDSVILLTVFFLLTYSTSSAAQTNNSAAPPEPFNSSNL